MTTRVTGISFVRVVDSCLEDALPYNGSTLQTCYCRPVVVMTERGFLFILHGPNNRLIRHSKGFTINEVHKGVVTVKKLVTNPTVLSVVL